MSKKRKERRRNTPDNAYSEGIIEAQIHGLMSQRTPKQGVRTIKRVVRTTKETIK